MMLKADGLITRPLGLLVDLLSLLSRYQEIVCQRVGVTN